MIGIRSFMGSRVFSIEKVYYDTNTHNQFACSTTKKKNKNKCGRWPPIELDAQADGIGVAPTKRFLLFSFFFIIGYSMSPGKSALKKILRYPKNASS